MMEIFLIECNFKNNDLFHRGATAQDVANFEAIVQT